MQDTTPVKRHPRRCQPPGGLTRRARGQLRAAAAVLLAACAPATPVRAQDLVESSVALQTSDVPKESQGAARTERTDEASAPNAAAAPENEAAEELDWDDYDHDPLERPGAELEDPTGDALEPTVAAGEDVWALPSGATVPPPCAESAASDAPELTPPVQPWTSDELDAWEQERVGPRYFDNVDHAAKPALLACVRAAAYFPHLLRRYDALGRCSFEESRQARRQFGEDAQVFCTRPSFAGCRLLNGVERFYYAYGRRLRRTPRTFGAATQGAADLAFTAGMPGEGAASGSEATKLGARAAPAEAP